MLNTTVKNIKWIAAYSHSDELTWKNIGEYCKYYHDSIYELSYFTGVDEKRIFDILNEELELTDEEKRIFYTHFKLLANFKTKAEKAKIERQKDFVKTIEKRIEFLIKEERSSLIKEKEAEETDNTGNIYFYRGLVASYKRERKFLSVNLLGNSF